jgi:hypothetical protein
VHELHSEHDAAPVREVAEEMEDIRVRHTPQGGDLPEYMLREALGWVTEPDALQSHQTPAAPVPGPEDFAESALSDLRHAFIIVRLHRLDVRFPDE